MQAPALRTSIPDNSGEYLSNLDVRSEGKLRNAPYECFLIHQYIIFRRERAQMLSTLEHEIALNGRSPTNDAPTEGDSPVEQQVFRTGTPGGQVHTMMGSVFWREP
jgi:hypothetical protein